MTVLTSFFAIFAISYINGIALVRRLSSAHADIWNQLGKPTLAQSNFGAPRVALMRHVWSFAFLKVKDGALTFHCLLAIACEFSLLVLVILLVAYNT